MPSLLRRESSTIFAPSSSTPSRLRESLRSSSTQSFVRRGLKRSKPVNNTNNSKDSRSQSAPELEVFPSSPPVEITHRIEDDEYEEDCWSKNHDTNEDEDSTTESTRSLSWSSLRLDDDDDHHLDDDTLPLVIHAWHKCKRRASQQRIGNLLLQRLHQLEPDKCEELLRIQKKNIHNNNNNRSNNRWSNGLAVFSAQQQHEPIHKNDSTLLLHQLNWHTQALRLAEFVDHLVESLQRPPGEFKTLLKTYWRQQHSWGWNLTLSHATALAAAVKMALEEIPLDSSSDGSALSDEAYYAVDQLNKTIFFELQDFQATLISCSSSNNNNNNQHMERKDKEPKKPNRRMGGGFLDPIKW